jgi:hypothetical protein
MELARGLEPLTCCLQDSCATGCATPARRLFPLVGGPQPLRMKSASRVHLLMSVHFVCNQVRGTIHGLLSDGTDQGSVHVAGDRDARMPEELEHTALSAPEANIKPAAVIFDGLEIMRLAAHRPAMSGAKLCNLGRLQASTRGV